jgi:hypothetical protein
LPQGQFLANSHESLVARVDLVNPIERRARQFRRAETPVAQLFSDIGD